MMQLPAIVQPDEGRAGKEIAMKYDVILLLESLIVVLPMRFVGVWAFYAWARYVEKMQT